MSNNSPTKGARRLVESALMLALGVVLSMLKFIDLPYGGSVTVASMLPILIIAYRHGMGWGTLTGFVYGLFQMLLGLNTFSYVTTWQSIVAVALLDYLVAFLVLGFGGLFKKMNSQPIALTAGTIIACVLRYLCHVISGATVWAGLSIPTNAALIYSVGYNATYMIPEAIITAILAYYIGSMLDFRSETIDRFSKDNSKKVSVLKIIAGLLVSAALVFDVRQIFVYLQNEDGVFDFSGLSSVNWLPVVIVTCIAIVVAVVLSVFDNKHKAA